MAINLSGGKIFANVQLINIKSYFEIWRPA